MKELLKDFKNTKGLDIYYGFLHLLVAFTSIVFVCQVTGFNIPLAFLTVGIGTILFHGVTKNKLASIMGVSGSYVGGMIAVNQQFGLPYVVGGVIISAVIYMLFGLLLIKWQDKVMKLFPNYILNMAVFFIALTLIPIGLNMAQNDIFTALMSILFVLIFDRVKPTKIFAMPLGLIAGTIISTFKNGLLHTEIATTIQFTTPAFNLQSFSLIGVVSLAVIFEALGDTKNTGNAQGIDAFKEVGIGKILFGNGLSSLVSGSMGSLPLTTYSENVGFLYMSKYTKPTAQLWTAIFYIALAFISPLVFFIGYIPMAALGGLLLYLFSLIGISTLNELHIENDNQSMVCIVMMIMFFAAPYISTSISPIALAMIVGLILNIINKR